jgi:hypothetical protein
MNKRPIAFLPSFYPNVKNVHSLIRGEHKHKMNNILNAYNLVKLDEACQPPMSVKSRRSRAKEKIHSTNQQSKECYQEY